MTRRDLFSLLPFGIGLAAIALSAVKDGEKWYSVATGEYYDYWTPDEYHHEANSATVNAQFDRLKQLLG